MSIRILPEKVASQIAAGEVIERPASVVRELVDNSIDAGADRISVSLERGGRRLIRVRDNGAGMSRDDLLLSVERHATSKIESVSDLFSVKTLGFRGEALPSIGSVSRVEMVSRPSGELVAHRLKIAGGKFLAIEETGAPEGTSVEVRDLFFNLPARRKFLRAPGTETGHVVDFLFRVAIPFPQISIRLEEEGRSILDLPAAEKFRFRFSSLLGRDVAESMILGEDCRGPMGIKAYLAPPRFGRSKGDRLFVYVNGRNIRDRLVNKAVLEGYGRRIMKGQYPQAVLFLEVDPSLVDVNVHPTKQEVRFREGREVFQLISSAVDKALGRSLHQVFAPETEDPGYRGERPGTGQARIEAGVRPERKMAVSEAIEPYRMEFRGGPAAPPFVPAAERSLICEDGPRVIGQLAGTYILCQEGEDLLIVDQHAAHERIVYEKLKKSVGASKMQVQTLLVPMQMELSFRDGKIILENLDQLARIGIELEHFGGNTFLLRGVPAILKGVAWESFLPELAAEIRNGPLENDRILDNVISVMACHGSVRGGQDLSREEMAQVLSELEKADLPTNCPHGRPVLSRIPAHELEKMFKRVL